MKAQAFVWKALRARRALLAVSCGLLVVEAAASLAVPWLGGKFAAQLLSGDAWIAVAAMIVVALLFQAVLRFAIAHSLDRAADDIVGDLRVRAYERIQGLRMSYFVEDTQGGPLALLTSDVYVVGGYVSNTLVTMVPLTITAAGAAIMMFAIDPVISMWVGALLPAYFIVMKLAARAVRPVSARLQDEEAAAVALARENIALMGEIKSFTREAAELSRFGTRVARIKALAARQRLALAGLAPAMQFLAGATVVIIVGFNGARLQGAEGAAMVVSLFLYAQLLARPLAGLADFYGQTQVALAALFRLQRVMREPAEEVPGAPELGPVQGDIEFRDVRFAYPDGRVAIDGFDLTLRRGEVVALVGENGSGKSTLAHLLLRLYDPQSGSIHVDGTDIGTTSRASVRRQMGFVSQHVLLANASIAENIAYGAPGADREAILAAARASGVHAFASRLPAGYETVVGENGVRLSGGERQRVALARALLKKARVLILDEATAMLDPAAEREFVCSCLSAFAGCTVLWITHRAGPLSVADRIVHLRAGRVASIEAAAGHQSPDRLRRVR